LFGGDGQVATGNGAQLHLGRTEAVRSQCCAQFVVARDRIWQHSRDEYIALRQWLLDGSSDTVTHRNAAPRDDRAAGRILSNVWHILFIRQPESDAVDLEYLNAQACPRADECYCRLYGRCNHCASPGNCRGQYSIPKDFKLPEGWAATHS
jgi:hypothetical protein